MRPLPAGAAVQRAPSAHKRTEGNGASPRRAEPAGADGAPRQERHINHGAASVHSCQGSFFFAGWGRDARGGREDMTRPRGLSAPLGCARRRACTCGPPTRWSSGGLRGDQSPLGCAVSGPASRLDAFSGYPSRTRLPGACRWRDNRHTGGPSAPVLSYWGRPPSRILRPQQIGTELSRDVLNPAHVPL